MPMLPGCKPIGATQLEGKFYVICSEKSEIFVYNQSFFKFPSIAISNGEDGLRNPRWIAASKYSTCLYIVDGDTINGSSGIWRVNLTTNGYEMYKFVEDEINSLSVLSENGRLMVISNFGNILTVYSPDGRNIWKVNLDQIGFTNTQHIVETIGGSFILSQSESLNHRVCEVDADFSLVQSYGGVPGSDTGHLDTPVFVAKDSRTEHVFVSDSFNRRILLFDRQLRRYTNLMATSNGRPWSIDFDSTKRILLVITFNDASDCLSIGPSVCWQSSIVSAYLVAERNDQTS